MTSAFTFWVVAIFPNRGVAFLCQLIEGELFMADDRTNRGGQDRSRINLHEDYEVRYWTEKFGVSKEQLEEAVRKVGSSASAVAMELKCQVPVGD